MLLNETASSADHLCKVFRFVKSIGLPRPDAIERDLRNLRQSHAERARLGFVWTQSNDSKSVEVAPQATHVGKRRLE